MKFKSALGFLLVAVTMAGVVFWQKQSSASAPDVVFKTIKGETIALAELQDKPVLVTFWASDCPSCLEEIPDLINLHRNNTDKGLHIIAVAMPYDPPNQVLNIVNEKQIPYAVALDPGGELGKAFGNVQFTPTSFLIDKSGKIIRQQTGRFSPTVWQKQISEINHALE